MKLLTSVAMAIITTVMLVIFVKVSQTLGTDTGTITLISVASDGTQGNGRSYNPSSTSANGRFVAFSSEANNLVPGNLDSCTFLPAAVECTHVFVHDQLTGETFLISKSSDGTLPNKPSNDASMSDDGRYVAFLTEADNLDGPGIYVHHLSSGTTTNISSGGNFPSISANGRFIAYGLQGVYLHDRDIDDDEIFDEVGQVNTIAVSVALDSSIMSASTPSVSDDGSMIAFSSSANNLVNNDNNSFQDIFVRNRDTDGNGIFDEPGMVNTILISVSSNGTQGNWDATYPSISGNGRFVVFTSRASNLVSNDTNDAEDVFIHDILTGITQRVSVAYDSTQGNGNSWTTDAPSVSVNGRFITFCSYADNLGMDGFGGCFIHDRMTSDTTKIQDADYSPTISQDGRYVVFPSGSELTPDSNGYEDVFLYDRHEGQATTVMNLPASGGILTSLSYDTTLEFPPGTFTGTTNITYTGYLPSLYPIPTELAGGNHYFDITVTYSNTGQIAQPTQFYTITVQYSDEDISGLIEDTLGIYYWDENQWILEESSNVDMETNSVVATPNHASSWAVLGTKQESETFWVYLPLVVNEQH